MFRRARLTVQLSERTRRSDDGSTRGRAVRPESDFPSIPIFESRDNNSRL